MLADTDKSAIDPQNCAFFPPTYAKSGGIKPAGGKGIDRSYESERESVRLKLGGEYLEAFLLNCNRNASLG